MLTQKDLQAIKRLIELVIEEKGLVSRKDVGELISFLPTKDEFYEEMERIYTKLNDMDLEKNILVARTADNTKKISSLEEIHPEGRHRNLSL